MTDLAIFPDRPALPAAGDLTGDVTGDSSFDRYARIVQEVLRVPVALVSLIEPTRQVFVGAVGLPEPWASTRQAPLTHSFCHQVVTQCAPLIVTDATTDRRGQGNLALTDLGLVAYAGYPLRDSHGEVIGSLCAIDAVAREWAPADLLLLEDLAHTCSTEIALRESQAALTSAIAEATNVSLRARTLLALSEGLNQSATLADVAATLQDVVVDHLGALHAGVWLSDELTGDLGYVHHPSREWKQAEVFGTLGYDRTNPIGAVAVTGEAAYYPDRAGQDARFPAYATDPLPGDGQARAILPLTVAGRTFGALAVLWEQPRTFSEDDVLTVGALASYTSQAAHRALMLTERTHAATILQSALLTDDLPQPDGLEIAARYLTSRRDDKVGGDWYDAVVMPSGATNLMIGDVVGHDIAAAAVMGNLRSMLRGIAWAVDDTPSANVARLDRAARDLQVPALATLVYARIEQTSADRGSGIRRLRWTTAGHPSPILVQPDGACRVLDEGYDPEPLLGLLPDVERHDHEAEIPVGATLVLYTDGLYERRGEDIDASRDRLLAALGRHHALPLPALVDAVVHELVGRDPRDDVAILAVRFHPQP
ncbi:MAG TPA: GAF domain-containing SpoIIE family protein phosphatase [Mycobacteriales bacterium]|nr:GAF domain-containing SpoIIE family protein phosphatase [Mycobacteriales bacterium]